MREELQNCRLCPRGCGADRRGGQRGCCGAGGEVEIFRYGAHLGEEPPISGTRGSGTVFFSRCTLRCIYCQNYKWSQLAGGTPYSVEDLTDVLMWLQGEGCHNINLVSPTPWLPWIEVAAQAAVERGFGLPFVYNTSGFESGATLARYARMADVYLVDLRYASAVTAAEGSGEPRYPAVARDALLEMWRRRGPLRTNADGIAVSGVICRLLILPGRADEVVENLRWLADAVGTGIALSVMAQYLPAHLAAGRAGWNRRITREEYDRVCAEVERLGFADGWIQDFGQDVSEELAGFQMRPGRG